MTPMVNHSIWDCKKLCMYIYIYIRVKSRRIQWLMSDWLHSSQSTPELFTGRPRLCGPQVFPGNHAGYAARTRGNL